jgi:hypothetical protein
MSVFSGRSVGNMPSTTSADQRVGKSERDDPVLDEAEGPIERVDDARCLVDHHVGELEPGPLTGAQQRRDVPLAAPQHQKGPTHARLAKVLEQVEACGARLLARESHRQDLLAARQAGQAAGVACDRDQTHDVARVCAQDVVPRESSSSWRSTVVASQYSSASSRAALACRS